MVNGERNSAASCKPQAGAAPDKIEITITGNLKQQTAKQYDNDHT